MSNLLFMDESNGNGVYAAKPNNSANSGATSTNKPNNIDNIMAVTSNSAAVAATLSTSVSSEDLSQSLSEYTDADESISAPTEFLAEFLSAVMLKNYKKALKYCKLILQYEPHNATAKDFYPLILEKLHGAASSDSDENYNKSSSPDAVHSVCPSAGESDEAASDDQCHHQQQQQQHRHQKQQAQQKQSQSQKPKPKSKPKHDNNATDDSDDCIPNDDIFSGEARSLNSSGDDDGGGGGEGVGGGVESLSSVSMDEDVDDDVDDDDDDDEDEDDAVEDDFAEDAMSSSGDDLPNDDGNICLDNAFSGLDNASHSSHNSSSGAESGRSRSDNTSHSYSSLLLEEDDDILPTNTHFANDKETPDLDVSNGNKLPSASCSDSESPTEPLTQRLAAILLSKCGVSSKDEHF